MSRSDPGAALAGAIELASHGAVRTTPPTTAPPPSRPARILLVGDSVAQTLGRGLERWAMTSGRASVWNGGMYFCGIFRGGEVDIGMIVPPARECEGWSARWAAQLDRFDPDIVVVLSTVWDRVPRRLPEWDRYKGLDDPEYQSRLGADYREAVELLSSRGAEVRWLSPPCHGKDAESDADLTTLRTRFVPEAVRSRPDVAQLVDLHGLICAGGRFHSTLGDVPDARPDGLHFSDPGADWVAAQLGPVLLADWTPTQP